METHDALVLHAAAEADSDHAPRVFGEIGDRYTAMVGDIIESLGTDGAAVAINQGGSMHYSDAVEYALDAIGRTT